MTQNNYPTVTIGNQVWMARELDVRNYRNGDPIRHVVSDEDWRDAGRKGEGAWCRFMVIDEISGQYVTKYYLYNGYAVFDPRRLAPGGWHIPTLEEWMVLINYLGGEDIAGGKLKETGIDNWDEPNTGATNSSGFSALGGGLRTMLFPSASMSGQNGSYWTSTQGCVAEPIPAEYWAETSDAQSLDVLDYAYALDLKSDKASIACNESPKSIGILVRCIRD